MGKESLAGHTIFTACVLIQGAACTERQCVWSVEGLDQSLCLDQSLRGETRSSLDSPSTILLRDNVQRIEPGENRSIRSIAYESRIDMDL